MPSAKAASVVEAATQGLPFTQLLLDPDTQELLAAPSAI
jgi:hypothetical protein